VIGPAEAATKTARPPTPVKLFEAELSQKTSLYRIGSVDYPVLLSVDDGTLM
jgi:hypothetical protein